MYYGRGKDDDRAPFVIDWRGYCQVSREEAIRWITRDLPGDLQEKRVWGTSGGSVEGMYNKWWNIYSFIFTDTS